ncbi:MAG: protease inhibitor I42 family protein [Planctomycetaceae bacterium]|nr:protease inhibitor I42 family protein [Planctomycetaceae bacterium]
MKTIVTMLTLAVCCGVAAAGLCSKCTGKMFTCDIGKCTGCGGDTSSGAFKLCHACSDKQGKCQACLAPLAAATQPAAQAADKSAGKSAEKPAALMVLDDQNGKSVELVVGQSVVIRLKGNMTTGFAWHLGKVEGDAAKLLGKIEYEPDPARGRVGSGGTFVTTFEAVKVGQATVVLEYKRPWEKDTPPAKTFKLTMQVKAALAAADAVP